MSSIRFDKKWFNPLYFILNDILKDDSIRTVLMYGGKSSSKTVSCCQLLSKELIVNNNSSICFRKESTTIQTTLKESFNLARRNMYLAPKMDKLEFSYRNNESEAKIILKGLDDSEKAKGVESFTYLMVDELNQFEKAEWLMFKMSLRGKTGQKIFATWNPVSDRSWVKTDLVDTIEWIDTDWKLPCLNSFVLRSKDGATVLIKTTFEDNYWTVGSPCGTYGYRDEALINEYKSLKSIDFESYRVNVLGEWGKIITGTEFYHGFKHARHVADVAFIPNSSIHLSFDFNVVPYCSMCCFQFVRLPNDRWQIRCFDEFCMPSPYNDPDGCIKFFLEKYSDRMRDENGQLACRVYYYGDATGRATSTTGQKDGFLRKNNFHLIKDALAGYLDNGSERVPSYNPHLKARKQKMNRLLSGEWIFDLLIDKSCKHLIGDFENVKEDADGTKLKQKKKDKVTGQSYEEFGHCSDCADYVVFEAFKPYMK